MSGTTQSTILNATHRIGVNQSDPSYSVHINAVDAMLISVGASGERPNDLTNGLLRILQQWYITSKIEAAYAAK